MLINFILFFIYLLGWPSNHFVCSSNECEASKLFRYSIDTLYRYKYTANLSQVTLENYPQSIGFSAIVSLYIENNCSRVLSLENVIFTHNYQPISFGNDTLSHLKFNLQNFPIKYFDYNGLISDIYSDFNDSTESINIKRGIVSHFQNTMTRFDLDHECVETDVSGHCWTHYKVVQIFQNLHIIKSRNYSQSSCLRRVFYLPQVPYETYQSFGHYNIWRGDLKCKQIISGKIFKEISCVERNIFDENKIHSAIVSTARSSLVLHNITTNTHPINSTKLVRKQDLLGKHDQNFHAFDLDSDIDNDIDLFKQLCNLSSLNYPITRIHLFLIRNLSKQTSKQIIALYMDINSKLCHKTKEVFINALSAILNLNGFQALSHLVSKFENYHYAFIIWLKYARISAIPQLDLLNAFNTVFDLPFVSNGEIMREVMYTYSSLVHRYCQLNTDCHLNIQFGRFIEYFTVLLYRDSWNTASLVQILESLHYLENTGIFPQPVLESLNRYLLNKNVSQIIRVSALNAFRRVDCEIKRAVVMNVLEDTSDDSLVRITAFNIILGCIDDNTLSRIVKLLEIELSTQVRSFIWSKIVSLTWSIAPNDRRLRMILSSVNLQPKYYADVRRFSFNWRYAMNSPSFDELGLQIVCDVVYSSHSYFPTYIRIELILFANGLLYKLFEIDIHNVKFEKIFQNNIYDSFSESYSLWSNSIMDYNIIEEMQIKPILILKYTIFGEAHSFEHFDETSFHNIFVKFQGLYFNNILQYITKKNEYRMHLFRKLLDISHVTFTSLGLPLTLSSAYSFSSEVDFLMDINTQYRLSTLHFEQYFKSRLDKKIYFTAVASLGPVFVGRMVNVSFESNTFVHFLMYANGYSLVHSTVKTPYDSIKLLDIRIEKYSFVKLKHLMKNTVVSPHLHDKDKCKRLMDILELKLCYLIFRSQEFTMNRYWLYPFAFSLRLDKSNTEVSAYEWKWNYVNNQDLNELEFNFRVMANNISRFAKLKIVVAKNRPFLYITFNSPNEKMIAKVNYLRENLSNKFYIYVHHRDMEVLFVQSSLQCYPILSKNFISCVLSMRVKVLNFDITSIKGHLGFHKVDDGVQRTMNITMESGLFNAHFKSYAFSFPHIYSCNCTLMHQLLNYRQRTIKVYVRRASTRDIYRIHTRSYLKAYVYLDLYDGFFFERAIEYNYIILSSKYNRYIKTATKLENLKNSSIFHAGYIIQYRFTKFLRTFELGCHFKLSKINTSLQFSHINTYNTTQNFLIFKYAPEKTIVAYLNISGLPIYLSKYFLVDFYVLHLPSTYGLNISTLLIQKIHESAHRYLFRHQYMLNMSITCLYDNSNTRIGGAYCIEKNFINGSIFHKFDIECMSPKRIFTVSNSFHALPKSIKFITYNRYLDNLFGGNVSYGFYDLSASTGRRLSLDLFFNNKTLGLYGNLIVGKYFRSDLSLEFNRILRIKYDGWRVFTPDKTLIGTCFVWHNLKEQINYNISTNFSISCSEFCKEQNVSLIIIIPNNQLICQLITVPVLDTLFIRKGQISFIHNNKTAFIAHSLLNKSVDATFEHFSIRIFQPLSSMNSSKTFCIIDGKLLDRLRLSFRFQSFVTNYDIIFSTHFDASHWPVSLRFSTHLISFGIYTKDACIYWLHGISHRNLYLQLFAKNDLHYFLSRFDSNFPGFDSWVYKTRLMLDSSFLNKAPHRVSLDFDVKQLVFHVHFLDRFKHIVNFYVDAGSLSNFDFSLTTNFPYKKLILLRTNFDQKNIMYLFHIQWFSHSFDLRASFNIRNIQAFSIGVFTKICLYRSDFIRSIGFFINFKKVLHELKVEWRLGWYSDKSLEIDIDAFFKSVLASSLVTELVLPVENGLLFRSLIFHHYSADDKTITFSYRFETNDHYILGFFDCDLIESVLVDSAMVVVDTSFIVERFLLTVVSATDTHGMRALSLFSHTKFYNQDTMYIINSVCAKAISDDNTHNWTVCNILFQTDSAILFAFEFARVFQQTQSINYANAWSRNELSVKALLKNYLDNSKIHVLVESNHVSIFPLDIEADFNIQLFFSANIEIGSENKTMVSIEIFPVWNRCSSVIISNQLLKNRDSIKFCPASVGHGDIYSINIITTLPQDFRTQFKYNTKLKAFYLSSSLSYISKIKIQFAFNHRIDNFMISEWIWNSDHFKVVSFESNEIDSIKMVTGDIKWDNGTMWSDVGFYSVDCRQSLLCIIKVSFTRNSTSHEISITSRFNYPLYDLVLKQKKHLYGKIPQEFYLNTFANFQDYNLFKVYSNLSNSFNLEFNLSTRHINNRIYSYRLPSSLIPSNFVLRAIQMYLNLEFFLLHFMLKSNMNKYLEKINFRILHRINDKSNVNKALVSWYVKNVFKFHIAKLKYGTNLNNPFIEFNVNPIETLNPESISSNRLILPDLRYFLNISYTSDLVNLTSNIAYQSHVSNLLFQFSRSSLNNIQLNISKSADGKSFVTVLHAASQDMYGELERWRAILLMQLPFDYFDKISVNVSFSDFTSIFFIRKKLELYSRNNFYENKVYHTSMFLNFSTINEMMANVYFKQFTFMSKQFELNGFFIYKHDQPRNLNNISGVISSSIHSNLLKFLVLSRKMIGNTVFKQFDIIFLNNSLLYGTVDIIKQHQGENLYKILINSNNLIINVNITSFTNRKQNSRLINGSISVLEVFPSNIEFTRPISEYIYSLISRLASFNYVYKFSINQILIDTQHYKRVNFSIHDSVFISYEFQSNSIANYSIRYKIAIANRSLTIHKENRMFMSSNRVHNLLYYKSSHLSLCWKVQNFSSKCFSNKLQIYLVNLSDQVFKYKMIFTSSIFNQSLTLATHIIGRDYYIRSFDVDLFESNSTKLLSIGRSIAYHKNNMTLNYYFRNYLSKIHIDIKNYLINYPDNIQLSSLLFNNNTNPVNIFQLKYKIIRLPLSFYIRLNVPNNVYSLLGSKTNRYKFMFRKLSSGKWPVMLDINVYPNRQFIDINFNNKVYQTKANIGRYSHRYLLTEIVHLYSNESLFTDFISFLHLNSSHLLDFQARWKKDIVSQYKKWFFSIIANEFFKVINASVIPIYLEFDHVYNELSSKYNYTFDLIRKEIDIQHYGSIMYEFWLFKNYLTGLYRSIKKGNMSTDLVILYKNYSDWVNRSSHDTFYWIYHLNNITFNINVYYKQYLQVFEHLARNLVYYLKNPLSNPLINSSKIFKFKSAKSISDFMFQLLNDTKNGFLGLYHWIDRQIIEYDFHIVGFYLNSLLYPFYQEYQTDGFFILIYNKFTNMFSRLYEYSRLEKILLEPIIWFLDNWKPGYKIIQKTNGLFVWFWNQYYVSNGNFSLSDYFQRYFQSFVDKIFTFNYNNQIDYSQKQLDGKSSLVYDIQSRFVQFSQILPFPWYSFSEWPKFYEISEINYFRHIKRIFLRGTNMFWYVTRNMYRFNAISSILNTPIYSGFATLSGSSFIHTFDDRYFFILSNCKFILISDKIENRFLVYIDFLNKEYNKKVIGFMIYKHVIEIGRSNIFGVTVDGVDVLLPFFIHTVMLTRYADVITIEITDLLRVNCDQRADTCSFELSDVLFSNVNGLLGEFVNNPSTFKYNNHFSRMNFNTHLKSLLFQACSIKNTYVRHFSYPLTNDYYISNHGTPVLSHTWHRNDSNNAICWTLISDYGGYAQCHHIVDVYPYLSACLNTADIHHCAVIRGYVLVCQLHDVTIKVPNECARCDIMNQTIIEGSKLLVESFSLTEIVFVVEAKLCNRYLSDKKIVKYIVYSLEDAFIKNNISIVRYTIVSFGGINNFSSPQIVTVSDKIFNNARFTVEAFSKIILSSNGTRNVFQALRFAAMLSMDAGIYRSYILLLCSSCGQDEIDHRYSTLSSVFRELQINVHVLTSLISTHEDAFSDSLLGFDRHHIWRTNLSVIYQVQLRNDSIINNSKSFIGVCDSLARINTNGSVFSVEPFLRPSKNRLRHISLLLQIFSRRVLMPYSRTLCEECECVLDVDGSARPNCYSCASIYRS